MTGPLTGVRIIDLTTMISGPWATMILGDQGADVIKVEPPGKGDHIRSLGNRRNGMSAMFLNVNRSKRSVTIDLKTASGLRLFKDLAATADVVVQNFRPGVADRLGIGEPQIRSTNPRLIYVSISGFGEAGPYAQKPTYDPVVQALSGVTSIQAGSDEAHPRLIRTILPDKLAGVTAAQAIAAALYAREKTGEGQHVRLSMLNSMMAFLWASDMGAHTFASEQVTAETAASFIDLIYETTERPYDRGGDERQGMGRSRRGARQARMAQGPSLLDARLKRPTRQRASGNDAGGAASTDHGRVDGAVRKGRRTLRAGSDPA